MRSRITVAGAQLFGYTMSAPAKASSIEPTCSKDPPLSSAKRRAAARGSSSSP